MQFHGEGQSRRDPRKPSDWSIVVQRNVIASYEYYDAQPLLASDRTFRNRPGAVLLNAGSIETALSAFRSVLN